MKTDLYTKVILTIIAACLLVIVLGDVRPAAPAYASYGNQPVQVDIVAINGQSFSPLQVSVLGPALPVKMEK